MLSAFAGGKVKAGQEVGQDQDWSIGFLTGLRQHPSMPFFVAHHLWVCLQIFTSSKKSGLKKINKLEEILFLIRNFSFLLAFPSISLLQ